MNVLEKPLEPYMPTEAPVWAVTDVDFKRWVAEDVRHVLFGAETLGAAGCELLIPDYVGAIAEAREAGIEGVGLWVGSADQHLVDAWQEQTEADIVLSSLSTHERKSSQRNPNIATHFFDAKSAQMGVVDDMASGGLRGAYLAGYEHRAWTRPFGSNRWSGSRLLREPVEAALRVQAHLVLTPKGGEQTPDLTEALAIYEETGDPEQMNKILGFDPPEFDRTKIPVYRKALDELIDLKNHYSEVPVERLKNFFHENGRVTADILTKSRLVMAAGIMYVNTKEMDPTTRAKINTAIALAAAASDIADGKAARADKAGGTKKGAANDQNIDKILSAVTDLFVLLPQDAISTLDLSLCVGRDFGMTALRTPFKQRGIDTKSVLSGKAAMFGKSVAQVVGPKLAQEHPKANQALQHTVTGLKIASMIHGPYAWIAAHERKQHAEHNWQRLAGVITKG